MNDYYLMTFESTHAAISTEKLLKDAEVRVMPVPRFISASCGIALRIRPDRRREAERLFTKGSELTEDEYAYYHISSGESASDVICERLKPGKAE